MKYRILTGLFIALILAALYFFVVKKQEGSTETYEEVQP